MCNLNLAASPSSHGNVPEQPFDLADCSTWTAAALENMLPPLECLKIDKVGGAYPMD